jgi:hypothetical protein
MGNGSLAVRRRTRELEPLAGLSAISAVGRLRELELRPAVEPCESGPSDHGLVVAHEPDAGTQLARGQIVTLFVGEHPAGESAGALALDGSRRVSAESPAVVRREATVSREPASAARDQPGGHTLDDATEQEPLSGDEAAAGAVSRGKVERAPGSQVSPSALADVEDPDEDRLESGPRRLLPSDVPTESEERCVSGRPVRRRIRARIAAAAALAVAVALMLVVLALVLLGPLLGAPRRVWSASAGPALDVGRPRAHLSPGEAIHSEAEHARHIGLTARGSGRGPGRASSAQRTVTLSPAPSHLGSQSPSDSLASVAGSGGALVSPIGPAPGPPPTP